MEYYKVTKESFADVIKAYILDNLTYQELKNSIDKDWVFMISHQMFNTGAPIELLNMAKILKETGKLPIIFSPSNGPLVSNCVELRIPVVIIPSILSDNFIENHLHLASLIVANTMLCHSLIYKLNGCGHNVLWWIHESESEFFDGRIIRLPCELSDNIHIFCVSWKAKKLLLELRPNYTSGILPIYVSDEFSDKREYVYIKNDKTNFLIAAPLTKNKGQDVLMDAIELLDEKELSLCHFIFVGKSVDENIKSVLDKEISQHPGLIEYHDEIEQKSLFQIYNKSDCIICASRSESLSLTMVEAMMFRKNLICSENAGIANWIKETNCGLLYSNDDSKELVNQIKYVLDHKNDLEEMRLRARNTYEKNFTKESFSDLFLEIVNQYSSRNITYEYYVKNLKEKNNNKNLNHLFLIALQYKNNLTDLFMSIQSISSQKMDDYEILVVGNNLNSSERKHLKSIGKNLTFLDEKDSFSQAKYIIFMETGDLLSPDALLKLQKEIKETHPDLVYTDHSEYVDAPKTVKKKCYKPDFAPDTLKSGNYIGHNFVVKSELLLGDKTLNKLCDLSSADYYDLLLRCSKVKEKVVHISEILFTVKEVIESEAELEKKRLVLQDFINLSKYPGMVSLVEGSTKFRVKYALACKPLVSIIICNKNHYRDLKKCLDSIFEKTTYPNYEIIIIDNGSKEEDIMKYYKQIQKKAKIINHKMPFDFAKMNNLASESAKGEYLLFLNNDTEVITSNWIEEMLMHCQRDDVGLVGAKLLFEDGTIQHAGVILGVRGAVALHAYEGVSAKEKGYDDNLICAQNYSAITGACLMIRRALFKEVNEFDENLKVTFNDLDLCFKVSAKGKDIVWTPFVELFHYESKSRGKDLQDERKTRRSEEECEYFRKKWKKVIEQGDPFFNKNFDRGSNAFKI